MMKMDYEYSVDLALLLGFKRVKDDNAYRGEYFIKDNKKWIHSVKYLKANLGIEQDEELRNHGYDVDSYYKYKETTNEIAIQEIKRLKEAVENPHSVLFDEVGLLDDNEALIIMGSLAREGLDEEILADYYHQISKR